MLSAVALPNQIADVLGVVGSVIQESRTYSVADISAMLNISRASAYRLTGKGYFKVLRIGKTIRISKKSFDTWLEESEI